MGIYKASNRLGKREAEEQWVHEPQHYKINTHALPYGATVGFWSCTKRHTARLSEVGRMLDSERQCLQHSGCFSPTATGGGISICFSGKCCPCNYILCDLKQNWKSNIINSKATGHAMLRDSADLCSLQRCFHPLHQKSKVSFLQSSQERVTDWLWWVPLWPPSVAPGNVPLKPIFNYSVHIVQIDTAMWLLPDQKEAQTNPKQAASAL